LGVTSRHADDRGTGAGHARLWPDAGTMARRAGPLAREPWRCRSGRVRPDARAGVPGGGAGLKVQGKGERCEGHRPRAPGCLGV